MKKYYSKFCYLSSQTRTYKSGYRLGSLTRTTKLWAFPSRVPHPGKSFLFFFNFFSFLGTFSPVTEYVKAFRLKSILRFKLCSQQKFKFYFNFGSTGPDTANRLIK